MQKLVLLIIKIYQKTISPNHGFLRYNNYQGCRYFPSCSEYTSQAIEKKGIFYGLILSIWRLTRCNPFSRGGYDPL